MFTEDETTNFKGSIQIITAANQLKSDSNKVTNPQKILMWSDSTQNMFNRCGASGIT
ncbi:MAG TPA: hypothetical protein VJ771_00265 [Candidatus Nitrosotalea sp.]|nr:hypothetical protein [Candidatus Nitrosotalea sp.]